MSCLREAIARVLPRYQQIRNGPKNVLLCTEQVHTLW